MSFQILFTGESWYAVKSILVHPAYNPFTVDNDFALLESVRPFQITPFSFIACLPKPGLDVTGKPLTVSGWGLASFNPYLNPQGFNPPTLQFTTLYGISNEECYISYDQDPPITRNMLCVKSKNNDTAECKGDSGGNGNVNAYSCVLRL
jgi:hypothetical protein